MSAGNKAAETNDSDSSHLLFNKQRNVKSTAHYKHLTITDDGIEGPAFLQLFKNFRSLPVFSQLSMWVRAL